MNVKRLPIKCAREIGQTYGVDQVVVLAWLRETGLTHVVTWGRTLEDCDQAAQGGNRMKREMGWPEADCQAEPSRVRNLKARIATLEADSSVRSAAAGLHPVLALASDEIILARRKIRALEGDRDALIALYASDSDPRVAMARERKARLVLSQLRDVEGASRGEL